MKTKIGKLIVKQNGAAMSQLSKRYMELAKLLKKIKPDALGSNSEYIDLMSEAKENRASWQMLQDEITELAWLESYLE
jgi:hypothetical protein